MFPFDMGTNSKSNNPNSNSDKLLKDSLPANTLAAKNFHWESFNSVGLNAWTNLEANTVGTTPDGSSVPSKSQNKATIG